MTREYQWRLFAVILLLLNVNTAVGRPNVLLILTEDQGAQMSALGTKGLQTPHMDSIAAQGAMFKNAFVAYPVCSASKAAIYTGLYSHTNGCRSVCSNHPPGSPPTPAQMKGWAYTRPSVHKEIPTLIEMLHAEGYYTGVSMKLHVVPVEKFPYDEFIRNSTTRFGNHGVTDGKEAVSFIRRAQAKQVPWFLCYTISMPHRPFRNSDKEVITVDPADVEIPPFLPNTPVMRKDWAEYLDSIEAADDSVGDALAALKETESLDDTLVIFLGDHGPAYQRGKMTAYDFGLRVPMAIMGPGVRTGQVTDELASELDLMPTILEYAGIDAPALQHGHSLWPILRGDEDAHGHDYVFGEVHHDYIYSPEKPGQGGVQAPGMQERSVFDGRYHLIYRENFDQPRNVNADLRDWNRWLNRAWDETIAQKEKYPRLYEMIRQQDPIRLGGTPPQFELFDLATDPHEMTDLTKSADHKPQFDRMLKTLRQWATDTNDKYITLGRNAN